MIKSYFNKCFFVLPFMALILFVTLIFANKCEVYAAVGFDYYSYSKIYNQLPAKYQKDDYIYINDGVPLISFATYNDHDYRTSVKKSDDKDNFIYCCDYSKHIVFGKIFTAQNNLFKNNELRARIGTALHNGTTEWGKKANEQFTTGNFITDYYMTQVVIHSLIYKYGGDYSSYGVKFDSLQFKSNTGTIKSKAKALYEYCCDSKITLTDGNFQNPQLYVTKLQNNQMLLDGDFLSSDYIICNTYTDGATIKEINSNVVIKTPGLEQIKSSIQVEKTGTDENFKVRIKIPIEEAEKLSIGTYEMAANIEVKFERAIAGIWKSTNNASQETTGLITNTKTLSDNIDLKFVIGDLRINKTDNFTGEIIPDAEFGLFQYNYLMNDFEYYKPIPFNNSQFYECGKIFTKVTNNLSLFKIIEMKAGNNYKMDWDGATFNLSSESNSFEFSAENQPIMGTLIVDKKGEDLSEFNDGSFKYNTDLSLEGITFSLYAANNIYKQNQILFNKDDFIVNFVTDANGKAVVNDLPMGDYYFKETNTLGMYYTDPNTYSFSITRDENKKYSEVTYNIVNYLKKCRINIFKYDNENDQKKPLSNARFGLYCGETIYDYNKKVILEKDSLISEDITDADGKIVFSDLPYADYYVKELKAPDGYIINDGIVNVKKEEFNIDNPIEYQPDNSYSQYDKNIDIINKKQLYCLKISKSGEQFTDFENQNSDNGAYVQYVMQQKPLAHVSFNLYSEDGLLLQSRETDEDGIAYFPGLPIGKYYYAEDVCPDIYNLKQEKNEIIIKPITVNNDNFYIDELILDDSQKRQPIIDVPVNNTYCDASLYIRKNGEMVNKKKNGLHYNIVPLSNIVFGIYQNFDYTFSDTKSIPIDSCVGYLVTMEDGTARFKEKLPEGKYYLKEIKTAPGYELDNNIYEFELKANNHKTINILLDNNNEFINHLSKATVQINKTDADTGKKLKGVEFTLYNEDSQVIGVYKTDKKGKIIISDLPYGNYYFIETKAKHGYYATNNKYKFSLDSPEGVVLNITNAPILKLGFEEHYRHALAGILVIIAVFSFIIYFNRVKK